MRRVWAFVHNALAHPLLAVAPGSEWSLRFHDWTARRAWPDA